MRRFGELFQGFRGKGQKEMPPHLRQWLKDAEAFGIPENVQKGLLFFAGIGLGIRGVPEGQSMETVLKRMSKYLYFDSNGEVNLPTGVGANFDSGPIGGLLFELARKRDPEFTPPKVKLPTGGTFSSFNPYPGITLPSVGEGLTLASSARLSHAFYGQLGDHIEGFEPEEIIVSGLQLFNGYYQLDPENIVAVCRFALGIRPPHHDWIFYAFLEELDEISSDGPFTKALIAFCSHRSAEYFLGLMLYKKISLMAKPQELSDPIYLCRQAISSAREITEMGHFASAVAQYAQELRPIPGYKLFHDDPENALENLLTQVQNEWGYTDIAVKFREMTLGEQLDRLCCLLIAAMRDATWKATPTLKTKEKTWHLSLWKSFAEKLEIPENIQKGLIFFTSIEALIYDGCYEEDVSVVLKRMSRQIQIRDKSIHIPPQLSVGVDFESIAGHLVDLENASPENMVEAGEWAYQFYGRIGDSIADNDLEEALMLGIAFLLKYELEDKIELCRHALKVRPPHMQSLWQLLHIDNTDPNMENMEEFSPMVLVLNAFYDLAGRDLCRIATLPLVNLTPESYQRLKDAIREITAAVKAVFDASNELREYIKEVASTNQTFFLNGSDEEKIKELKTALNEKWGYAEVPEDLSLLYVGKRYDLLCCVLLAIVGAVAREI